MKLISWNVSGIRTCLGKELLDLFKDIDADILGLDHRFVGVCL